MAKDTKFRVVTRVDLPSLKSFQSQQCFANYLGEDAYGFLTPIHKDCRLAIIKSQVASCELLVSEERAIFATLDPR